ncbi:MAG: M24 family metallopeptidase, partial [Thermomicrobia bacterium]|nr:M24 family metallopeptidase [Thermomicrobia bacterium]
MARGSTMTLKSPQEIAKMRVAGQVVAQALEAMRTYIHPGVTTAQVDAVGEAAIRKAGATPSFKGLYGFPASVCVAVNDEVVHGIPGKRTLRNGDIIKVDTGAFLNGWHGDATLTVPVGEIDEESRRLVDTTYDALMAGIAQCR